MCTVNLAIQGHLNADLEVFGQLGFRERYRVDGHDERDSDKVNMLPADHLG